MDEKDERMSFRVVVNHEDQYSVWSADRANAPGWRDTGKTGDKDDCLEYVEDVWTDMRPLSLRRKMAEASAQESGA